MLDIPHKAKQQFSQLTERDILIILLRQYYQII